MCFLLSLKITFTLGPYSSNSCNITILVVITLTSSKEKKKLSEAVGVVSVGKCQGGAKP